MVQSETHSFRGELFDKWRIRTGSRGFQLYVLMCVLLTGVMLYLASRRTVVVETLSPHRTRAERISYLVFI